MSDRIDIVEGNFLRRVKEENLPASHLSLPETGLTPARFIEIFESQILSRQLDNISRKLQARGEGFYTIGSSGHEGNAAIAAAFRVDDMAFLHYRDAGFLIQRSKKLPGQTPLWDMLLSFVASSEDPISGGRHKVLGSRKLFIPPQTSTIASHLPKAVGMAYSIELNKWLGRTGSVPEDSLVLCSFGDASFNHSTAQGALNAARWTSHQDVPLPLVFVCEDNGIGISTRTPSSWIETSCAAQRDVKYFACNGLDILDTYHVAREVERYVRATRKPAFLHMLCIRLFGHAGADAESNYLTDEEIENMEGNDPLLCSAGTVIENGLLSAGQVIGLYNDMKERVASVAEEVIKRPKLSAAEDVASTIIPPKSGTPSPPHPTQTMREEMFGSDMGLMKHPQNMARLINWTLADLMLEQENMVLAGEDIGPKGGVYTVTSKLHKRFGARRVINTLLDEQSILGLAIGLTHNGILPVPEIQFLAYLHNAEDQLRGEASTLSFFSQGQFTNPMVIRIAGLPYQKGFGGHFHNDNSFAVLRDIPGIIVACPSSGAEAVPMLRECVRLAREEQRVVVFLEPIALYMMRDLHEDKDGLWLNKYEPHGASVSFGEIGQHGKGTELAIITYGNGYYLSRQAEKELTDKYKIKLRIIDLRWLVPLNKEAVIKAIEPCKSVLIVDECRKTGSLSEELMALIYERMSNPPKLSRLTATDCFISLGRASTATLPDKDGIIAAALNLTGKTT